MYKTDCFDTRFLPRCSLYSCVTAKNYRGPLYEKGKSLVYSVLTCIFSINGAINIIIPVVIRVLCVNINKKLKSVFSPISSGTLRSSGMSAITLHGCLHRCLLSSKWVLLQSSSPVLPCFRSRFLPLTSKPFMLLDFRRGPNPSWCSSIKRIPACCRRNSNPVVSTWKRRRHTHINANAHTNTHTSTTECTNYTWSGCIYSLLILATLINTLRAEVRTNNLHPCILNQMSLQNKCLLSQQA